METERQRETPVGHHFINLYQDCPRKWFLRYVCGWLPNKTARALLFGQAWHTGVEEFYRGRPLEAMIDSGVAAIKSNEEQYSKREHFEEDLNRMPGMLRAWQTVIGERWDEYEIVTLEQEFRIDLYDGVWMTIRPDAIIRHKLTNTLWVVEHKTTGYSMLDAQENVIRGDQATAYMWGASNAGYSTCGVLLDVVYNRKSVIEVEQTTITRSTEDMITFELSMNGLFREVATKYALLATHAEPVPVLFPRNGSCCSKWGCEYEAICRNRYDASSPCPGGFNVDRLKGPHPILSEVFNGPSDSRP